jgi:hypothetical protein
MISESAPAPVPGTSSSVLRRSSKVFTGDGPQERATAISRFMLPIQVSLRGSKSMSFLPMMGSKGLPRLTVPKTVPSLGAIRLR